MDDQEDTPVQENPPEAPLAQPIVPPTQMMMYSQLPTPPPVSLKGYLAENWTFFRESWESYKIATELDKKPKPVILETLKVVLGRETYQIAKNLPVADRTDPDNSLQALTQHFEPQKNIIFERYLFNSANQENENIDQYLNRLRKLASTCTYGALCDELIRDRLVIGIKSHEVRKRLLREKALTLNTALDIIRAAETASDQLKKIDGELGTSVHAVKYRGKKPDFTQRVETVKQCKYCGTNHNLRQCTAYGKKCGRCNMKRHFAKMCRSRDQEPQRRTQKPVKSVSKKPTRSIHRIEEAEPAITDDEVYYMYSVIDSSRSKYMIELQLRSGQTSNWIEVTMQIDSGSEANCLRMEDFVKIQNRPDLKKTRAILKAYNGERVFPKGEIYPDPIQILQSRLEEK